MAEADLQDFIKFFIFAAGNSDDPHYTAELLFISTFRSDEQTFHLIPLLKLEFLDIKKKLHIN